MKENSKTLDASEFKAHCQQILDEVTDTGEPVIISKNGRAVAELSPIKNKPTTLFGAHAGQIKIVGDIISPIDQSHQK